MKIGEKKVKIPFANKISKYETQKFPFEEYYNIGLLPDSDGNFYRYSENAIRHEHGFW